MRLILLFLSISFSCIAQLDDSLLAVIRMHADDTNKITLLYNKGFSLRNSDPQLAARYSDLCEKTALKVGAPFYTAKSLNLKGVLLFKKGNFSEALTAHEQALSLRQKIGDSHGIAISLLNLGNIYSAINLFEKAGEKYLEALNTFEKTGDRKNVANCLLNLGVVDQSLKKITEAEQNYILAYKIATDLNNYETRCLCLNNLAQVYYDQGDYEKSIAYNNDALKLRLIMDNNVETADSYLNLASCYIKLRDFESAKFYLDTAYTVANKFEYFEALQIAYQGYADFYSETKEYEKAYSWLSQLQRSKDSVAGLQIAPTMNFPSGGASTLGQTNSPLHNMWLLVSVFIIIVFVPLFLVRYTR